MPDTVWVVAGYFGLAVLSAVVPWFNAEVVMLSAVPLAASPLQLGLLVGAVTAGQMTGKATMSPASASVMSTRRLMTSVRGVLTKPSEKMSQLGRRSVTRILPVSFS